MIDGIDHYWIWIALGLLLAVLELLVPGVYLIWLAVAALVTGALAFVLPFGWPLEIVSFNGQVVLQTMIDAAQIDIPASEWSAGMYFLRATNKAGTITRTFAVQ